MYSSKLWRNQRELVLRKQRLAESIKESHFNIATSSCKCKKFTLIML
jgi:hypothetical protein